MTGMLSQLSVALTVKGTGGGHVSPTRSWTDMLPGQLITGGIVSTKVMCWTQVLKLPHASVAFQVRSIPGLPVQLGGVGASVELIVTVPPQLSVAVAEPVFDGSVESPHCNCLSGGQVISGGVVSTKVMCWTQVLELPHASVAFQVRSIPGLPVQLGAVGASVELIVTVPPQLSVAVAEPVFDGSVESPHCNCLSGGQVISGGVVSTKVMCWT